MGQFLLLLVVALVVAAVVFGVITLITDPTSGLGPHEPDGRAAPLPSARPLTEADLGALRLDTELRGYRMGQVDQALRRIAYDIGYKEELIAVLEAEVVALREGRTGEADELRGARLGAVTASAVAAAAPPGTADPPQPTGDDDDHAGPGADIEGAGTGDDVDPAGPGADVDGAVTGAGTDPDGTGAVGAAASDAPPDPLTGGADALAGLRAQRSGPEADA